MLACFGHSNNCLSLTPSSSCVYFISLRLGYLVPVATQPTSTFKGHLLHPTWMVTNQMTRIELSSMWLKISITGDTQPVQRLHLWVAPSSAKSPGWPSLHHTSTIVFHTGWAQAQRYGLLMPREGGIHGPFVVLYTVFLQSLFHGLSTACWFFPIQTISARAMV